MTIIEESLFSGNDIKTNDEGVLMCAKTDFYWGLTSREDIESFLTLAKTIGYEKALKEYVFKSRFDYAHDVDRSDFLYYLPVNDKSTVLDIGSGYGNVTIPLSRHVKHVVAVDASLPLLRFSKMRAEAEGRSNITYAHVDSLENNNLPFKEKTFDFIILNGVLEWVGPNGNDPDPRNHQLKFLEQLKKLLKDNGVLYIGIENRLFFGWLGRDPHSKLKWTVILPRPLADMYAKYKGMAQGYRTYIYSAWGYVKLLKEAGFLNLDWLYTYPSYRRPDYIYDQNPRLLDYILNSGKLNVYTQKWTWFLRFLSIFKLDFVFLSSYLILASNGKKEISTSLILQIAKKQSDIVLHTDSVLKVYSKNNVSALLFHKDEKNPYAKIEINRNSGILESFSVL